MCESTTCRYPSDLPQLVQFIEDCLNLDGDLAHSIGAVLDKVECWPQAAWLRRWAVEAFVVPTLQSAISKVAVRRRVLRAGEPCDVQVEPAAHVVVELGAVDEADGVRHWLVGCRVRVKGLRVESAYTREARIQRQGRPRARLQCGGRAVRGVPGAAYRS